MSLYPLFYHPHLTERFLPQFWNSVPLNGLGKGDKTGHYLFLCLLSHEHQFPLQFSTVKEFFQAVAFFYECPVHGYVSWCPGSYRSLLHIAFSLTHSLDKTLFCLLVRNSVLKNEMQTLDLNYLTNDCHASVWTTHLW